MRAWFAFGVLLGLASPALAQMSEEEVQQCVFQCNANHDTQDAYFACVEERCNDSGGGAGQAAALGVWHLGDGEYGRYAGVMLEGFDGNSGGILYFCSGGTGRLVVFGPDGGGDSQLLFTIGQTTFQVPLRWVNNSWWEVVVPLGDPLVEALKGGSRLYVSNPGVTPFWDISLAGSGPALAAVQVGC